MHRKTWIAGHTFASGFGGAGEVSFLYFASGAQAYAPPDLPRSELIAAIGRGIGRGAAHEFAHLIGYAAHASRDRGSYEYHAASRPEQYFRTDALGGGGATAGETDWDARLNQRL